MSYAEVGGASAVSKVCVFEVGGASHQMDAWLLLWEDGISVHPAVRDAERTLMLELSQITSHRNDLFFLLDELITLKHMSNPRDNNILYIPLQKKNLQKTPSPW